MGCGCKGKALTPQATGISRSFPSTDETGTIMMQSAPECTRPYNGPFRRLSVLVAGYGTEHEQLFRRNQRNDAIRYARQHKVSLDPVPASALCDELAVALLGS